MENNINGAGTEVTVIPLVKGSAHLLLRCCAAVALRILSLYMPLYM